jgi:AbrB family looped-hinge helix DNA binding protein
MATIHDTVRLGAQGRLVVPAALRRALGLHAGDTLVARVEDGRLVLETRASIKRRLQARYRQVAPDRCLSDELIAERRAEARREAEEA